MENELAIRLSVFIGLFLVFAALETLLPKRIRTQPRSRRWLTNWSLVVIDTLALRALAIGIPALAVGAAVDASLNGYGLFNVLDWNPWLEGLLAVLFFDFAIWFQHLITHKIPILWRLHRVHHADRDIDVTTAVRFHPVEILFSMLLKIGLVYLIGPAAWAMVAFEVILNGTAMFNHANIALPAWLDRIIRKILVTPDMHRIHHSTKRSEHDSNYGFSLSLWDKMFGTYTAEPQGGEDNMTIGLEWQDDQPSRLGWSLALPFSRK
ncbi:MAG TPA: sterol desaturase family protein [Rhodobacteraceae bacterium]|nr:sterol desaturase family protein [Paracoccaceae bacterium]